MKLGKMISSVRLGCEEHKKITNIDQSEFKKDFDRILFSNAFRRLQGKTQLFPFPNNDHTRNRLTHSLDVYSIARSLGIMTAKKLNFEDFSPESIGDMVGAAALAHDIGNSPFGHSGEESFSHYFRNDAEKLISSYKIEQKSDLQHFNGNAVGFRILSYSKPQVKNNEGGFGLTYSTLASFLKYPTRSSLISDLDSVSENKNSFFSTEESIVEKIFSELGISKKGKGKWFRYPFAFLVEAADDIAFHLIDLEDGFRNNILSFETVHDLLLKIIEDDDKKTLNSLKKFNSNNSKIGYLRFKAINSLTKQVADIFCDRWKDLANYRFDSELMKMIKSSRTIDMISDICKNKLCNSVSVVEIEIAGYEIINGLLNTFIDNMLINEQSHLSHKIKGLIPMKFLFDSKDNPYANYDLILNICEYISGMTDSFALNLYRKLKGIDLPNH